jgi:hypothetical protein
MAKERMFFLKPAIGGLIQQAVELIRVSGLTQSIYGVGFHEIACIRQHFIPDNVLETL